MGSSALDPIAVVLCLAIALVITVSLALAHRAYNYRRGWIVAGVVFLALSALGIVDLLRYTPRETLFSTVLVGFAIPVLGALGLIRATMNMRPWIRWPLVFVLTAIMLVTGFLVGAAAARWLPF